MSKYILFVVLLCLSSVCEGEETCNLTGLPMNVSYLVQPCDSCQQRQTFCFPRINGGGVSDLSSLRNLTGQLPVFEKMGNVTVASSIVPARSRRKIMRKLKKNGCELSGMEDVQSVFAKFYAALSFKIKERDRDEKNLTRFLRNTTDRDLESELKAEILKYMCLLLKYGVPPLSIKSGKKVLEVVKRTPIPRSKLKDDMSAFLKAYLSTLQRIKKKEKGNGSKCQKSPPKKCRENKKRRNKGKKKKGDKGNKRNRDKGNDKRRGKRNQKRGRKRNKKRGGKGNKKRGAKGNTKRRGKKSNSNDFVMGGNSVKSSRRKTGQSSKSKPKRRKTGFGTA